MSKKLTDHQREQRVTQYVKQLEAENASLQARVEVLEEALGTLAHETYNCGFMLCSNDFPHVGGELLNQAQIARKALESKDA